MVLLSWRVHWWAIFGDYDEEDGDPIKEILPAQEL
jgi:hypothetical protein